MDNPKMYSRELREFYENLCARELELGEQFLVAFAAELAVTEEEKRSIESGNLTEEEKVKNAEYVRGFVNGKFIAEQQAKRQGEIKRAMRFGMRRGK